MEFKPTDIAALAKKSALNPKGLVRMLGSIAVSSPPKGEDSSRTSYNLGLRLDGKELFSRIQGNFESAALQEAVAEYRNSCPQVIKWLMRGDFDPTKVPDTIKSSSLLHASRTAGRLRAKIMRELPACG